MELDEWEGNAKKTTFRNELLNMQCIRNESQNVSVNWKVNSGSWNSTAFNENSKTSMEYRKQKIEKSWDRRVNSSNQMIQ